MYKLMISSHVFVEFYAVQEIWAKCDNFLRKSIIRMQLGIISDQNHLHFQFSHIHY